MFSDEDLMRHEASAKVSWGLDSAVDVRCAAEIRVPCPRVVDVGLRPSLFGLKASLSSF